MADLLVLDSTSPHLYGKNMDDILNALVFSGNSNMVRDVMCRGEWVVQDFRHKNEEAITAAYLQALDRLQSGL
jgi:formimidoylglutamate deiminase